MSERTYYNLEQIATMLQVSERTIMREIKAGKLQAFKVGKSLRFTPEALQDYIRQQQVQPARGQETPAEGVPGAL